MQGIYFLLSLVGFGIICVWFIQNDDLAHGKRTTGVLRMKINISIADPKSETEQSSDILKDAVRTRRPLGHLSR